MTYSPVNIKESVIRVLRSSNIDEKFFKIYNDDVFVDDKCVNVEFVSNGDILITAANGSPRLVGKHAIIKNINDNSAVVGGFMLLARTSNYDYINASMSSSWYKKFLGIYVAGGNGAIGNLNKNELDNYDILIPRDIEQEKIGILFDKLGNLITLHQRE